MRPMPVGAARSIEEFDAVIFDMDGVVTDTATVHAAAWKRVFDQYLEARSRRSAGIAQPFDADADYRRYVDGRPRYDGVSSFLESRRIFLPYGDPSDPPERETVCGLGNRKDGVFLEQLQRDGARAFPGTVALTRALMVAHVPTAIISSSRNMSQVLAAARIADLFPVRVDGNDAARLGLPGKPDPAIFLEAARRLKADASRSAVVEDAIAGVEAGRRGGFALVIGVDRTGHRDVLIEAGADVVVSDLGELVEALRQRDAETT
jgi:beta-phosphoglucomutase family hydrolase